MEMNAMDRMDYVDVCQSYIVGGFFDSWGAADGGKECGGEIPLTAQHLPT